ncbi:MAG: hypothetical protein IJD85_08090 [Oscillospiraceae bacterium]|nr:hypothetical protein [Oscillospiraceae bacterium]
MFDKTCPFCGKKLKLTPPSKEFLPNIMGRCTGGSGFLLLPLPRLKSYTKSPQAKYNDLSYTKHIYETQGDLTAFKFGHPSNELGRFERTSLITVNKIRKHLNRGGIHLWQKNLLFLCKNCRHPMAFNENPRRAKWIFEHIWFYLLVFYIIAIPWQLMTHEFNWTLMLSLLGVCVLITVGYTAFVFGRIKYLNKNRNNIAPLDDYASLARLPILITISRKNIPNKHLCTSNIFSTEIDEEKYQLYITNAKKDTLDLYICGINGEQEKLLKILRCNQAIPLYFGNKYLGNENVIATYEPPKEFSHEHDTTNILAEREWYCDSCGCTNKSASSECRSCGKYKS